jgi:hypothetical protein
MREFMRYLACVTFVAVAATALRAEDGKVSYRERTGKGGVLTASGRIESESLSGVKVAGKTIPSGEVIDIAYDVPGAIRLDYRSVAAETKPPAESIKEYEALLKSPAVQGTKYLKRQIEYRIAVLTAARADEGALQLRAAIDAIQKFKRENADAWQLVPLTRTLARLSLDKDPPDADAARKAYDELIAAPGAPPDVKLECTLQVIDLLMQSGKSAEAEARLAALPAGDPRVPIYQIGVRATPDKFAEAAKQLHDYIDKTNDPTMKAAAYNVLGDVYRRDPAHKKDALYAYLYVDVIYNQDAAETQKAVARLAQLFDELKDETRAKQYRERLRGK